MESEKDKVFASLIKIESSAAEIEAEMEAKRAGYAVKLDERIRDLDAKTAAEKETRLNELQDRLKAEQRQILLKMREDTLKEVSRLDEEYAVNHEKWAREIFTRIIEE